MTPAAEKAMKDILEKLQTGDLGALVTVAKYEIPATWPASKWTLGNQVLAYLQARTLNIRGFHQWQDVGRQVQAGSHGIYIWAPRMVTDEKDGEKKSKLIGFRPIVVFPIETTAGEPLPDDWTPRQLPPLHDAAARLGVTVTYQPTSPANLGDFGHNAINLSTNDPAVFWHELGHAAHRRVDPAYHTRTPEYKEIVAEFSACVIAALYDQDYTANTWRYLSMFADDPIKAVMNASAHIQKVLDIILDHHEEEQPDKYISNTYTQPFDTYSDADPGL